MGIGPRSCIGNATATQDQDKCLLVFHSANGEDALARVVWGLEKVVSALKGEAVSFHCRRSRPPQDSMTSPLPWITTRAFPEWRSSVLEQQDDHAKRKVGSGIRYPPVELPDSPRVLLG
jgi:hypothetical protein